MKEIYLNFINRSNGGNNENIVIYQPNETSLGHDEFPIAWKVIKNCGINESHSFIYSEIVDVAISDSFGGFRDSVEAAEGRLMEYVQGNLGGELRLTSKFTSSPFEFEVKNDLGGGSVSINCLRSGRVLATIDSVYHGESALFRFSENIFIGVAPDIDEGEKFKASDLVDTAGQLNLTGMESADIIMTGGGEGDNAQPLAFTIENIQRKKVNWENNPPIWKI